MKRKLDPAKPDVAGWSRADAMSDAAVEAAAHADEAALPRTAKQLAKFKRGPNPRLIRAKLGLTQEAFADRFGLPLGTVRDWEQGKHVPDSAAKVLLRVIENDPAAVARALAG